MLKNYIIAIKAPLIIICIFSAFHLLASFDLILNYEELKKIVLESYSKYGLYAVAFLSFIENIIGINAYFPGSIAILSAMSLSAENPILGLYTYLTIYGFAFISYNINYFIGRKIASNNFTQDKTLEKYSLISFILTFWHPHTASVTCVAAGEKLSYKQFFKNMLIASFIWNTFWAVLMYNIGLTILDSSGNLLNSLIIIYLVIWLLYDSYKFIKK